MKIKKLVGDIITPIKAITNDNEKGTLYYNIKHGNKGPKGWVYSMGLDFKIFKPTESNSTIELNDDDYIIIPVMKHGKQVKDKNGNTIYFITKDDVTIHKTDLIIFWEIPNKNYRDVKYEISGAVTELACGKVSRVRDSNTYVSPAPILEITGKCVLKWSGVDEHNKRIVCTINYDKNEFNSNYEYIDIGSVETKEKDDSNEYDKKDS